MPEPTIDAASPLRRQAPITATIAASRNCTITSVNNLHTYTLCLGVEITHHNYISTFHYHIPLQKTATLERVYTFESN